MKHIDKSDTSIQILNYLMVELLLKSIMSRFPIGSYIQIDGEINACCICTLSGGSSNEISVVRGALGTISSHIQLTLKLR